MALDLQMLRAIKDLVRHAMEIHDSASHNHTIGESHLHLVNGRCGHVVSECDIQMIDAAGIPVTWRGQRCFVCLDAKRRANIRAEVAT